MGLKKAIKGYFKSPTDERLQRFAWGLTAVISIALIWLNWTTIQTLSDRSWCTTLTGVEKYLHDKHGNRPVSPENLRIILEACRDIGERQLDHVAWVAKIFAVALGLVPSAVFVVKFAGANVTGNFGGANFSMNGHDRAEAAHEVADAAEQRADEIERDEKRQRNTEIME